MHSKEHITDVLWTHNGNQIVIKDSCIYRGGDKGHPALTILYASNADSGEYVCSVTFTHVYEMAKEKITEVKKYLLDLVVCGE